MAETVEQLHVEARACLEDKLKLKTFPNNWMSFVLNPEDENLADLVDLIITVRTNSWLNNIGLINEQFGGNKAEAEAKINERFADKSAVQEMLIGANPEATIAANALLIKINKDDNTEGVTLADLAQNPGLVEAIQLVGVDISGTPQERIGKWNVKEHVYLTLGGGLDVSNKIEQQRHTELADETETIIDGIEFPRTLYLGIHNTDKYATQSYTKQGYRPNYLRRNIKDGVFGEVKPWIKKKKWSSFDNILHKLTPKKRYH